jgi:hypothetical protein
LHSCSEDHLASHSKEAHLNTAVGAVDALTDSTSGRPAEQPCADFPLKKGHIFESVEEIKSYVTAHATARRFCVCFRVEDHRVRVTCSRGTHPSAEKKGSKEVAKNDDDDGPLTKKARVAQENLAAEKGLMGSLGKKHRKGWSLQVDCTWRLYIKRCEDELNWVLTQFVELHGDQCCPSDEQFVVCVKRRGFGISPEVCEHARV